MPKPESKINPDIKKIEVGIRELKELTLYPLSASFQLELAKDLGNLLVEFFSVKVNDLSDIEVSQKIATLFIELFQDNVKAVLEHAIDPAEMSAQGYESSDKLLDDISSRQFVRIGETVYEVNYEELVGKISSYLRKKSGGENQESPGTIRKIASAMKDASPLSADITEPTKSETSPSPTTKEE